jgi:hypothetical protein
MGKSTAVVLFLVVACLGCLTGQALGGGIPDLPGISTTLKAPTVSTPITTVKLPTVTVGTPSVGGGSTGGGGGGGSTGGGGGGSTGGGGGGSTGGGGGGSTGGGGGSAGGGGSTSSGLTSSVSAVVSGLAGGGSSGGGVGGGGGGGAQSAGGGGGGGGQSVAGGSHTRAQSARSGSHVSRFTVRRHWIVRHGNRRERATALGFRLSKRGVVVFRMWQIYPACGLAGTFRVRGHAGWNRVAFRGRVHRKPLALGTYVISVTRAGARQPSGRARLAILSGQPSSGQVRAAVSQNACGSGNATGAAAAVATPSSGGGGSGAPGGPAGATADKSSGHGAGTAGVSFSASLPARDGADGVIGHVESAVPAQAVPILLFFTLGAAMVLLAIGAVPHDVIPSPRLATALVEQRASITLAGLALVIGCAAAYVLVIL